MDYHSDDDIESVGIEHAKDGDDNGTFISKNNWIYSTAREGAPDTTHEATGHIFLPWTYKCIVCDNASHEFFYFGGSRDHRYLRTCRDCDSIIRVKIKAYENQKLYEQYIHNPELLTHDVNFYKNSANNK